MKQKEIQQLGTVLLRTGTLLMSSGANTGRIRTTVNRIAQAYGYSIELHISQRVITITLIDEDETVHFSRLKRTPPHHINFKIISGISNLSWDIVEQNWSLDKFKEELDKLLEKKRHPRWLVILLVGLAGSGFCFLADGKPYDLLFTFFASSIGLFIRQEAEKARFNPYVSVFFAAMVASLIAGFATKLGLGDKENHAFVTSVLFLIPGVPLINSFSDIIDGNIQNGIARGVHSMVISFTIALGVLVSTLIYHF